MKWTQNAVRWQENTQTVDYFTEICKCASRISLEECEQEFDISPKRTKNAILWKQMTQTRRVNTNVQVGFQ